MTSKKADGPCAHQACACQDAAYEKDGKRYCSASCANQAGAGHEQGRCRCGHPLCSKK